MDKPLTKQEERRKAFATFYTIDVTFGDCRFCFLMAKHEMQGEDAPPRLILHTHIGYEVHLCIGEHGDAMTEDQVLPMNHGDILILPPGKRHFAYRDPKQFSAITFIIEKTNGEPHFYDAFEMMFQKNAGIVENVSSELFDVIGALHRGYDFTRLGYCRAATDGMKFITSIFSLLAEGKIKEVPLNLPVSAKDNDMLLEALVNDNMTPLARIASLYGYSERQTARVIRERFGMPLTELRLRNRIASAKALLRSTDLPLAVIAEQTCFGSVEAMRAAFRKTEGHLPSEYRNR